MSDTVIRVENLSKKYILGQQKEGSSYKSLRESMSNGAKSLGKKVLKPGNKKDITPSNQEFWALKDVSFEIKQGDRVGIIGRNGAGKSTLLKVLSRITEPTSGSIRIKGRVASLLEVGTGFHPELTGRENIFLNGAILGMSKVEITRKFDEIVAFAEVEKFLDTPVKRYSSGMYVRLAFAVAAHLEPEILIVDEVLAVGDAQFQEKCLGKMEDVAQQGRTVLFVSHNMGAIKALCDKGIFLSQGKVIADGLMNDVIKHYIKGQVSLSYEYTALKKLNKPYFVKVIAFQGNNYSGIYRIDEPIEIKFDIEYYETKGLTVDLVIRNEEDLWIHHSSEEFYLKNSTNQISNRICIIPPYSLAAGKYYVDIFLAQRNIEMFECVTDALGFEVEFVGKMSDKTTANDWKGICGPGLLLWR